jgi:hypothetical protein
LSGVREAVLDLKSRVAKGIIGQKQVAGRRILLLEGLTDLAKNLESTFQCAQFVLGPVFHPGFRCMRKGEGVG